MRYTELKEEIKKGYNGFLLSPTSKQELLSYFPPKYPKLIGHHVTHKYGITNAEPLPEGGAAYVVGYADDGEGLEALVVEINNARIRPDGSIYHITWSLDPSKGKKPVHSNNLIKEQGFERITPPIPIILTPTFFPF